MAPRCTRGAIFLTSPKRSSIYQTLCTSISFFLYFFLTIINISLLFKNIIVTV